MGILFWCGITFFVGFFIGMSMNNRIHRSAYKKFTDEVYAQYLYLLKKHGIDRI